MHYHPLNSVHVKLIYKEAYNNSNAKTFDDFNYFTYSNVDGDDASPGFLCARSHCRNGEHRPPLFNLNFLVKNKKKRKRKENII